MNIKETFSSLLPGVDISDEFVTKLTASIESTVAQRVVEETQSIQEKANKEIAKIKEDSAEYKKYADEQIKEVSEKANAYAEYVVAEMTNKVDDYCEYVVEKFVKDNKDQLVESAQYAKMVKVINTIKEAFESNFYQLNPEPAGKNLEDQLTESKKAFNDLFEEHRVLKKQISDYSAYVDSENRKNIFNRLTEGMADTQKERLERLVEKTRFEDLEDYQSGVALMIEEFKQGSGKSKVSEEPMKEEKEKEKKVISEASSDKMKAYLERL